MVQTMRACDQRTPLAAKPCRLAVAAVGGGDGRRQQHLQMRALALRRPQQQWRQHLQQQCSLQRGRRQSHMRVPVAAAGPSGGEGKEEEEQPPRAPSPTPEGMPIVSATAFLSSATLGNGGMTAAGIVLGNALGEAQRRRVCCCCVRAI